MPTEIVQIQAVDPEDLRVALAAGDDLPLEQQRIPDADEYIARLDRHLLARYGEQPPTSLGVALTMRTLAVRALSEHRQMAAWLSQTESGRFERHPALVITAARYPLTSVDQVFSPVDVFFNAVAGRAAMGFYDFSGTR